MTIEATGTPARNGSEVILICNYAAENSSVGAIAYSWERLSTSEDSTFGSGASGEGGGSASGGRSGYSSGVSSSGGGSGSSVGVSSSGGGSGSSGGVSSSGGGSRGSSSGEGSSLDEGSSSGRGTLSGGGISSGGGSMSAMMGYEVVGTNQTLYFTPILFGNESVYRCVVTNFLEEVGSATYTLVGKFYLTCLDSDDYLLSSSPTRAPLQFLLRAVSV